MRQIFVSHTSANRELAYELVDYIEANGISCYIAPRDVEKGRTYASQLVHAIKDCELVLLIASEATNSSEYVMDEIDILVEADKALLPVFIEDFVMNDELRFYLGRKQRLIAYPDDPHTYFGKILNTIEEQLPKKPHPKKVTAVASEPIDLSKTTVFDYYPERGIMINPEDQQRNVSFRTDTLVNMLGGIFEKVESLTCTEEAVNIFFDSGYVSGKNFAERINNKWGSGNRFEDMKHKIEKWCEFDSAVGWGRFSSQIDIDEENDCLSGTIRISEPFIVDNKKKRRICAFIRGYCSGVIETLLNSVEVELTCRECPLKSNFRAPECVFDLRTK